MSDDDPTTEPAGGPHQPEAERPRRRGGAAAERPWPFRPLTPVEIERRLAEMPGWRLGLGGRSIVRRFDFTDFAHAQAFAGLVGTFAAAGRHFPRIELQRGRVRLELGGRRPGEVTGLVIEMAEQFERAARALGAGVEEGE